MTKSLSSIQQVVDAKLCSGCGACTYMQPTQIRMINIRDEGLRPEVQRDGTGTPVDTCEALKACPGAALEHRDFSDDDAIMKDMLDAWGPILDMWEGHAADEAVRFAGSSGGAASALAIYALEDLGFELVLHIAADPDAPYTNKTVASKTRQEVIARTGSRYAPASPCELLHLIEEADGPCLFIGKPCDVAAAQKARKHRPRLDRNLALTVAFFCAGTPSTNGTLALLDSLGVPDANDLSSVRYRGNGWPGKFVARERGTNETYECSYQQSWGDVLSSHVQWRCKLCIDHTGEFADVSVGDPWYRPIEEEDKGSSLIVARTKKGRQHVEGAIVANVLNASVVNPELLPRSQPNLLRTRGEVWGRMLGARLSGALTPTYRRLPSFGFWISETSLSQKARSVLGSMRRCVRQKIAFKTLF